jgi:hypothetical protein
MAQRRLGARDFAHGAARLRRHKKQPGRPEARAMQKIRAIVAKLYGREKSTETATDERAGKARTYLAHAAAEARKSQNSGWHFEGGDRAPAWMGKNRSESEQQRLKARDAMQQPWRPRTVSKAAKTWENRLFAHISGTSEIPDAKPRQPETWSATASARSLGVCTPINPFYFKRWSFLLWAKWVASPLMIAKPNAELVSVYESLTPLHLPPNDYSKYWE